MRLRHRAAVVTLVLAGVGLVSPSVASAQIVRRTFRWWLHSE